ncbi:MAG: AAA family ATPase [Deltaproteobacteria bacterium]|nr:AAA family ATPase [Deltaproteobacteria bacterium]
MQCLQCHIDNNPGRKFCGACGSPLPLPCERCGFANDPSDRFCGGCGSSLTEASSVQSLESRVQPAPSPKARHQTLDPRPISYTPRHLVERIRAEQAALEARQLSDGERKTITALFADIKGSMALIEDLDPEEARALIDPALQLMMDAVHRYEGYVVQSTGDGIFAFFGAPLAHEDHPQRALSAALRMQEDLKSYAERLRREHGRHLEIRVGVNTGDVVLRSIRKDDLRTDYTPISHSTSLASRLEGLAPGGSIVVSEQTYKLTEGYFEFKSLGTARVKGVSDPVTIYEVLGMGPLRTRLQVAARRGLTRFVGRQSEFESLRTALELAEQGHGQVVGVMGEPGVGKSRLFHEFLRALGNTRQLLQLETFSVSHSKAYPYLPLIDLLRNYFQITPQDDERRRREKITGRVLTLDRTLEDTLPYLFALLGLVEPTSSLAQMDPQIRQQRTFAAIKRLLARESLNQPLVLIFEDLHWLDAETQAFLVLLSESLATAKILLLVNYRPEYRHDWGSKTYYTQLRLDSLRQEDAQELLTALLGTDPTLLPLKQFILVKTEGNPFFMEELVRELGEQGVLVSDGGIQMPLPAELRIPTTVQAVLASRIDRLPAVEKALLQTLAVIGKEFPLTLLKQVAPQPDEELYRVLGHLQTAEFIYEQPAFPEVEYTFKHALTQEVAYNSLLLEQRKLVHERTAQATEMIFHSQLEDHYGDLAHHYSRSGNTEKAVAYLQLAGQQAVLVITKGYGAPEAEKVYTRAQELCQHVGGSSALFPAIRGVYASHLQQGKLQAAQELGEQLLRLAESTQDPAFLLEAYMALGQTLFFFGKLTQSQEYLEKSVALYDPQQHTSLAFLYGRDPGAFCGGFAGWTLWYLGYPDQALKKMQAALAEAYKLSHAHTLAALLAFAAWLYLHRGDVQATRQQAEAAITLSTEHGFAQWLGAGMSLRGWALAEQGQRQEGIEQMNQGMGVRLSTGGKLVRPYFLGLLAELRKVGQAEEGLALIDEALEAVLRQGQHIWEAELYRLKGELLLNAER